MFRLIRFVLSLAMLAGVVWFAVSVPLGKRTLSGHLRAIFSTPEAKDLADGTKEEAEKVADKVRQGLRTADMNESQRRQHAPLDPVEDSDRKKLQDLVKQKMR
jgi:hypothetical protein